MSNVIITDSDNNVVIQGGNNFTCVINGKKYINGVEVPYDAKEEKIKELLKKRELINTELEKLGYK